MKSCRVNSQEELSPVVSLELKQLAVPSWKKNMFIQPIGYVEDCWKLWRVLNVITTSEGVVAVKRFKIKYCYEDYMEHVSAEEIRGYQLKFAPLIDIISRSESDKEVMALSKEYDSENGTEMFTEAVHLMVYCIACSQFDCDC